MDLGWALPIDFKKELEYSSLAGVEVDVLQDPTWPDDWDRSIRPNQRPQNSLKSKNGTIKYTTEPHIRNLMYVRLCRWILVILKWNRQEVTKDFMKENKTTK